MTERIHRLRYAPETAVVDIALGILALLRESLLAAHPGLLDEHPPASRERRLAITLLRSVDRLARDSRRYLHHTGALAAPRVQIPHRLDIF
jgi:hypothetical protein